MQINYVEKLIMLGFTLIIKQKYYDNDQPYVEVRLTAPKGSTVIQDGESLADALILALARSLVILEDQINED